AEMIDAFLQLVALDLPFGTDRDDREVEMAVGQIGSGADALHDLEGARVGVEVHQLVYVFGENSQMADASHECISQFELSLSRRLSDSFRLDARSPDHARPLRNLRL